MKERDDILINNSKENIKLKPVESLTPPELQMEITELMEKTLEDPTKREVVRGVLTQTQEESLHLEHPITGKRTPINVNLLPTVLPKDTEERLKDFVIITNLVRAAILLRSEEDTHLKNFLNAGVHPIAIEIMDKNPFNIEGHQWRWRTDTSTEQYGSSTKSIENNGGEPQGDIIVTDAMLVNKKALSIAIGEDVDDFHERPDVTMMKELILRYQEATGKSDIPTIGYFAWWGKSSLSHAEARYTAQRYQELFKGDAMAFDPRDIKDIIKHEKDEGGFYYSLICDKGGQIHEIHVIRRLHGEPMENMDLWEEFRNTYGHEMCSDGEETIWDRFTSKLGSQMINPLNSRATDKKLDAMLGNPVYLEHFGIWEKVESILSSDELSNKSSMPQDIRNKGIEYIKEKLEKYVPKAAVLRRIADGFYNGDYIGKDICLSDAEIGQIKENRKGLVLKRYTLEGHSGTAVHVGRGLNPSEIEFEDFMQLNEGELNLLTGLSHEEFEDAWTNGVYRQDSVLGRHETLRDHTKSASENAQIILKAEVSNRFDNLTENEKEVLLDKIWSIMIDTSLNRSDCLIQEAVDQQDVDAIIFPFGSVEPKKLRMHCDMDPQNIAIGKMTFPLIRVTTAAKTNITGGYGALGAAIPENLARNVAQTASNKGIL